MSAYRSSSIDSNFFWKRAGILHNNRANLSILSIKYSNYPGCARCPRVSTPQPDGKKRRNRRRSRWNRCSQGRAPCAGSALCPPVGPSAARTKLVRKGHFFFLRCLRSQLVVDTKSFIQFPTSVSLRSIESGCFRTMDMFLQTFFWKHTRGRMSRFSSFPAQTDVFVTF